MAAASSSLAGSLPIARTRLIGREVELAAARSLLLDEAAPLLTLTGPGGVGKTRLALAVAQDVGHAFADGVVWVDFSARSDPTVVGTTLAAALQLQATLRDGLIDHLSSALRTRQVLLLLDNCEHLLETVADLVDPLLARCPALQVLATSRAPFHLRGERLLPVAPLSLPAELDTLEAAVQSDAVQLFTERVRAIRSTFTLTDSTAPTVIALCRHLDGLPLAIELAAARSTVLSLDALLAQMTDRLPALAHGMRHLPRRQETIAATIAWSYELLAHDAQVLCRRLAVFVGGFTLDAIQSVAARKGEASLDVVPALEALVAHNLVRRLDGEGEPRFAMLETIRAFALERLAEAGEDDAGKDAHAAYFIAFAERADRFTGLGRDDAMRQLAKAEEGNIRTALAHLIVKGDADGVLRLASGVAWYVQANHQEGRSWLEWALAQAPEGPTSLRGLALAQLAFFHWAQGDYDQANCLAGASRDIGELHQDSDIKARALQALGCIALSQHEYERSKSFLGQSLDLWRQLGERNWEAEALQLLAGAELGLGDQVAAERLTTESLGIYQETDYPPGKAATLSRLGRLVREQGNDRAAALAYHAALELCAESSDRFHLALAYAGLAELASRRQQPELAAALIGAIDTIAQASNTTRIPTAGVNYDRATAAACLALGEARFAQIRASGKALRLGDAVALARGVRVPPAAAGMADPPWVPVDVAERIAGQQRILEGDSADLASVGHPVAPLPAIDLTFREQEVLGLLGQRWTDGEIAAQLSIGPRTVSSHVSSILAKLGARNRREAAAIAARRGLL